MKLKCTYSEEERLFTVGKEYSAKTTPNKKIVYVHSNYNDLQVYSCDLQGSEWVLIMRVIKKLKVKFEEVE